MTAIKYQYVNNKLINELWNDTDADIAHALKQALYYFCEMNKSLASVAKDAEDVARRLMDSLVEGYEYTHCLMRTAERLVEYTQRRQGYIDTANQMLFILQKKSEVKGLKFRDLFSDEYSCGA